MSASRRMLVAWREVPSRQHRMTEQLVGSLMVRMGEEPRPHFWCPADRPPANEDTFAIRPVYNVERLPEGARCERCGVDLLDLNATLADAIAKSREERA